MKKLLLYLAVLPILAILYSCSNSKIGETSQIMSEETYKDVTSRYEYVSPIMSEGFAIVCSDNHKYGFVDKKGREIISCIYDEVNLFSQGRAVVGKIENNKKMYGFINKEGKEIVPLKYAYAAPFTDEKLAVVATKEDYMPRQYGFINLDGEEVIACQFNYADSFSEGLAVIQDEYKKYGYIDTKGEIVINVVYDFAEYFSDGFAWVRRGEYSSEKYYVINKKGETMFMLPKHLEHHGPFVNGLAKISDKDKEIEVKFFSRIDKKHPYGFINSKGEIAIPCKYQFAYDFEDGEAYVTDQYGRSFDINTKGEEIDD